MRRRGDRYNGTTGPPRYNGCKEEEEKRRPGVRALKSNGVLGAGERAGGAGVSGAGRSPT
jgi:hypothetical protein